MHREVVQSLDALALNARRLLNDAETVLSHGSHQTAASLAILVQGRDNKFDGAVSTVRLQHRARADGERHSCITYGAWRQALGNNRSFLLAAPTPTPFRAGDDLNRQYDLPSKERRLCYCNPRDTDAFYRRLLSASSR